MSFWSGLFGGSSSGLNTAIGGTQGLSGFSANQGQNSTTAGSNFFGSLLGGNPSQIAQTLAPEISQMQQGGQQQKANIAQFGNRSGGGNSAAQGIDSGNRASLTNLIGGLQSGAASTLLSSGQNLLGTALGGYGQLGSLSQDQLGNWMNSILGKGLSSGIGTVESLGLGKL